MHELTVTRGILETGLDIIRINALLNSLGILQYAAKSEGIREWTDYLTLIAKTI